MQAEIRKAVEADEFHTPEGCYILEVANSDTDENVSIARARVEPGMTTELHTLKGVEERYLIIEGSGSVWVGGIDDWVTVAPGDVVQIPAGAPQRIRNSGDADLVFYCVCTPRFYPDCYVELGGETS